MAGLCRSWAQEIFVFVTKIFREDAPLEVYNVYCMKPEVHSLTHTNKTAPLLQRSTS